MKRRIKTQLTIIETPEFPANQPSIFRYRVAFKGPGALRWTAYTNIFDTLMDAQQFIKESIRMMPLRYREVK